MGLFGGMQSAKVLTSSMRAPAIFRERLRCFAAVFAVALLVRLLYTFAVIPLFDLPVGPNHEDFHSSSDGYLDLARTLYDHHKLAFAPDQPPTTFRMPVFPFCVAVMRFFTGDFTLAVLLLNCIASAATVGLVSVLASRFFQRRSRIVSYSAAFFPLSIHYAATSFSDTMIGLTVVGYFAALLCMLSRPGPRTAIVGGLTLAIAILTKPMLTLFPPVLLMFVLFRRRITLRSTLLSIVIAAVGVSAWSGRNYLVTRTFIPISTGGGFNLLAGNYMVEESHDCNVSFKHGTQRALDQLSRETGRNWTPADLRPAGHFDFQPELDRVFGDAAVSMILSDPALLFRKIGVNATRFWYFSSSPNRGLMCAAIHFPVLVAAAIALVRLHRGHPLAVETIAVFITYYVLIYSVIIVHSTRFALPILLLLTPFAAHTIVHACTARGKKARKVSDEVLALVSIETSQDSPDRAGVEPDQGKRKGDQLVRPRRHVAQHKPLKNGHVVNKETLVGR